MITAQNLDTSCIELSRILLQEGVKRKTRGHDCIELPHPVMICITNPHNRYVTIKGRKASKTLPFGESLALLSGVNDIELYSDYVPDMVKYSDDGLTQRAGYGPRIRGFLGVAGDYKNFTPPIIDCSVKEIENFTEKGVEIVHMDQFEYVIKVLKKDPNSRQAVISITDPANDQQEFNDWGNMVLRDTKDIPCCRLLQFMIVNGKLDCTAYFRSNDVLFGFQQVNMFNNAWMQECLAIILGVPVGKYYHIANNMHFYEDKMDLMINNARTDENTKHEGFDWKGYESRFNIDQFNQLLVDLFEYRSLLAKGEVDSEYDFKDDLFNDWGKVFYRFHTKDTSVNFKNPYINRLFNRPVLSKGKKYVKVLHNSVWEFYEVIKPDAYIRQCKLDNKVAIYCGMADKYGYLNK